MQDPIIVMGMMRSGTTLIAEMVHKGGTPMFDVAGNPDPSYDKGIRYERPLAHEIDHEILGLSQNTIGMKIVASGAPNASSLQPISSDSIQKLRDEVGDSPWGFKNPRTTLTYPRWRQTFSGGATLYVYRSHQAVLSYHFKSRKNPLRRLKRMRMAANAWVIFNEKILDNIELDRSQTRPCALVRYEELMERGELVEKMQSVTGIPLSDARDHELYRCKNEIKEDFYYRFAMRGLEQRFLALHESLKNLSLK